MKPPGPLLAPEAQKQQLFVNDKSQCLGELPKDAAAGTPAYNCELKTRFYPGDTSDAESKILEILTFLFVLLFVYYGVFDIILSAIDGNAAKMWDQLKDPLKEKMFLGKATYPRESVLPGKSPVNNKSKITSRRYMHMFIRDKWKSTFEGLYKTDHINKTDYDWLGSLDTLVTGSIMWVFLVSCLAHFVQWLRLSDTEVRRNPLCFAF